MDDAEIDRLAGDLRPTTKPPERDHGFAGLEVLLGYRLGLGQLRDLLEQLTHLIVTAILTAPRQLSRLPHFDVGIEQRKESGEVAAPVRGVNALHEFEIR